MKHILKKFWIVICLALIINIPILILGTVRTNQSIMLKGDTSNINNVVEIDSQYDTVGSFSSIFVLSVDKCTILQSLFAKIDKTATVEELNPYYEHFSDWENYRMGQVQKNSSIMTSLITAYSYAQKENTSINIEYSFKSLCVSFYFDGADFRIDDEIIKINDIDVSVGYTQFSQAVRNSKSGDVVTVLRDNKEKQITLTNCAYNLCRYYPYYNINYDTINPKANVKSSFVGGPSGGLLQTLAMYNQLVPFDYTKGLKITGTGTMSVDGSVGAIGGIKQKIYTAFDDDMDVFLCPADNYEEALQAYNTIVYKEKMLLIKVSNFSEALQYLYYV